MVAIIRQYEPQVVEQRSPVVPVQATQTAAGGLGAAIAVSLGIFILNSSQPRIVELGRATGSVDYRALGEYSGSFALSLNVGLCPLT